MEDAYLAELRLSRGGRSKARWPERGQPAASDGDLATGTRDERRTISRLARREDGKTASVRRHKMPTTGRGAPREPPRGRSSRADLMGPPSYVLTSTRCLRAAQQRSEERRVGEE